MKKLKVLDLFAGIGGFTLGLDSTNFFETVKFVEKDKYCQKVLQKNFPNIPIEEDIKNVKGKEGEADVICGGFPCQPFSVAGKQKGSNHSFDTERASYISTTKTNVANSKSIESHVGEHGKHQEERSRQGKIRRENSHDANTYSKRLERFRAKHELRNSEKEKQTSGNSWWSVEPNVGRVANGVPGRVHRLKGLGNAIVPQIAKEIGLAIKKVINDI